MNPLFNVQPQIGPLQIHATLKPNWCETNPRLATDNNIPGQSILFFIKEFPVGIKVPLPFKFPTILFQ